MESLKHNMNKNSSIANPKLKQKYVWFLLEAIIRIFRSANQDATPVERKSCFCANQEADLSNTKCKLHRARNTWAVDAAVRAVCRGENKHQHTERTNAGY